MCFEGAQLIISKRSSTDAFQHRSLWATNLLLALTWPPETGRTAHTHACAHYTLVKKYIKWRKQAFISAWIESAQEWNRYKSSQRPQVPLWQEGCRCVHDTHFLFTAPDTHQSRDCNYKDLHNVASWYTVSVIASLVAKWQRRRVLATATVQWAMLPLAPPPPVFSHLNIYEEELARCRQKKTLAWVFSILSSDSYQC